MIMSCDSSNPGSNIQNMWNVNSVQLHVESWHWFKTDICQSICLFLFLEDEITLDQRVVVILEFMNDILMAMKDILFELQAL